MGIAIKSISNLSYKEQLSCLEQISEAFSSNLKPIEIDGEIYHIPSEVQMLIDSLWDLVEKPKDKKY